MVRCNEDPVLQQEVPPVLDFLWTVVRHADVTRYLRVVQDAAEVNLQRCTRLFGIGLNEAALLPLHPP